MTGPLVSICIPAYNQVEFLKRGLDSLCIQTYKNMEVVVSDDSADDRVKILVMNYNSRLQITYHRNIPSLGSPANWNKAVELAKGDFIKILHHDDWLASEYAIQKFVDAFSKNPDSEFAFCDSEILNVKENTISYNRPPSAFLKALKQDPRILFNDNRIGAPSAVMYRRTKMVFDIKMKFLVDLDFYMRMLLKNPEFIYIPEALITNTSNHDAQVTAVSMDKETQVKENCYLYNKVFNGKLPSKNLSLFFIRVFRSHKIKSLKDIRDIGGEIPRPSWFFSILILLAKI